MKYLRTFQSKNKAIQNLSEPKNNQPMMKENASISQPSQRIDDQSGMPIKRCMFCPAQNTIAKMEALFCGHYGCRACITE